MNYAGKPAVLKRTAKNCMIPITTPTEIKSFLLCLLVCFFSLVYRILRHKNRNLSNRMRPWTVMGMETHALELYI